jgi:hypothetical protein
MKAILFAFLALVSACASSGSTDGLPTASSGRADNPAGLPQFILTFAPQENPHLPPTLVTEGALGVNSTIQFKYPAKAGSCWAPPRNESVTVYFYFSNGVRDEVGNVKQVDWHRLWFPVRDDNDSDFYIVPKGVSVLHVEMYYPACDGERRPLGWNPRPVDDARPIQAYQPQSTRMFAIGPAQTPNPSGKSASTVDSRASSDASRSPEPSSRRDPK